MEDSEDEIDKDQLEEYREMVEDLGTFPDKVKINSLSMVAEDHADSQKSAAAIYNVIRALLISPSVHSDRKLPLVYVLDSILKNVKGEFVSVIGPDVKEWLPVVYKAVPEDKKAKLKKVWNLWKEANVFAADEWEKMGRCFSDSGANMSAGDAINNDTLGKADIAFGKDGGLVLMPSLRKAMQEILDDLQSDEQDELNKVSLERLAAIDPDLLVKIKQTAEDSLRNGTGTSGARGVGTAPSNEPKKTKDELSFLDESRSAETISRSMAWEKTSIHFLKESHDIIASLNHLVRESAGIDKRYTQAEAVDMTGALATAGVTATLLTNSLQQLKDLEDSRKKKKTTTSLTGAHGAAQSAARSFFKIDKGLFSNDGVKKLNEAIVGLLYEIGLPFVSSTDGQRFATQLELSQHLDGLFRKGQLEKTIASTLERGWYDNDETWCGESKTQNTASATVGIDDGENEDTAGTSDDNRNPESFTTPADESRDRCVICGINFKMFFDNDDGIYKYTNSREIEVLNDEAAAKESEDMLVHVTCWRNLGSPEVLTEDQTMN
jgi:pre-mRNA cleavage complex 2 protein Pcf11